MNNGFAKKLSKSEELDNLRLQVLHKKEELQRLRGELTTTVLHLEQTKNRKEAVRNKGKDFRLKLFLLNLICEQHSGDVNELNRRLGSLKCLGVELKQLRFGFEETKKSFPHQYQNVQQFVNNVDVLSRNFDQWSKLVADSIFKLEIDLIDSYKRLHLAEVECKSLADNYDGMSKRIFDKFVVSYLSKLLISTDETEINCRKWLEMRLKFCGQSALSDCLNAVEKQYRTDKSYFLSNEIVVRQKLQIVKEKRNNLIDNTKALQSVQKSFQANLENVNICNKKLTLKLDENAAVCETLRKMAASENLLFDEFSLFQTIRIDTLWAYRYLPRRIDNNDDTFYCMFFNNCKFLQKALCLSLNETLPSDRADVCQSLSEFFEKVCKNFEPSTESLVLEDIKLKLSKYDESLTKFYENRPKMLDSIRKMNSSLNVLSDSQFETDRVVQLISKY